MKVRKSRRGDDTKIRLREFKLHGISSTAVILIRLLKNTDYVIARSAFRDAAISNLFI